MPTTPVQNDTPFPVLVALTTDECVESTVKVAGILARERGATPSIVYVVEIPAFAAADVGFAAAALAQELADPATHQRDEAELRAACKVDSGPPAAWPFYIEEGDAASCIATRARALHAQLIIMGRTTHNALGRALGYDTAREVVSLGAAPVLSVRPSLQTLPKNVVVAIDFSHASVTAALLARQLMDERGTMHLIFVEPPRVRQETEAAEAQRLIQTQGIEAAFQALIATLAPGPDMTISPVRCAGDPVKELTTMCERYNADLLTIGSQRHAFLERLRVGSVAAAMLKDSRWSVLITPPPQASPGKLSVTLNKTSGPDV